MIEINKVLIPNITLRVLYDRKNRILTWRYHYNRDTALYYGHSIRAGNSCRQRSCRQISGFCRRRQSSFQTFTGHTGLLLITLNVAGTVPATFTRHTPFVPARGKPCRDGPTFYFLGLTYPYIQEHRNILIVYIVYR